MGSLFLPAAQNDQELQADLQSQLSPSAGAVYDRIYNFDVLEGFTGALVKQSALSGAGESGEKLSVDQLRKEYTDGLVNFDRPLTRAQAELIRDRKREELQRQDIWQRAEGWATASGVTASLAAGVVDPVGTAVGIVMAPAKGIQMLGGLRAMAASSSLAYRALGTAGLTAVDAAIGNAILEPYNLYSHQQYYADYTMADSLANVVFGGILGGTVGGGAVVIGRGLSHVGKWTPEWLRGKQEATHEMSLHTAVAQVLDGRPVQVEPVLRSDPNLRMAEGHPVQAAEMAGPRVDEPIPTLTDVIHTQETEISKSADVVKPDRPVLKLPKLDPEGLSLHEQFQQSLIGKRIWHGTPDKNARHIDKHGLRDHSYFVIEERGWEMGDDARSTLQVSTVVTPELAKRILPDPETLVQFLDPTGMEIVYTAAGRQVGSTIGRDWLRNGKALKAIYQAMQREGVLTENNAQFVIVRGRLDPKQLTFERYNGETWTGKGHDFTAASGKEVLDQAKQHMEAPRTGAADDVAEDFEAEILATHKDTAEYYEPAAKTRKMMELEKEIDYQQSRLTQEHGDVQVDGLKQADDALNKADDLRAAMVEGMACLLRK